MNSFVFISSPKWQNVHLYQVTLHKRLLNVEHHKNPSQASIFVPITSQQAQNICITFIKGRPNFFDVGPTLCKCNTNVL